MKTLTTIIKILSVASGGAAYFGWLPEKYLVIAGLVFACASTLKDMLVKVGDYLDNGQMDGSFKP